MNDNILNAYQFSQVSKLGISLERTEDLSEMFYNLMKKNAKKAATIIDVILEIDTLDANTKEKMYVLYKVLENCSTKMTKVSKTEMLPGESISDYINRLKKEVEEGR